MKRTYGVKSKSQEAAVGFVLGAVGGCILGATEDPVDTIVSVMTQRDSLKPVMEEARAVGGLGLGTLMGASALTTAMTSVIAGVILAAVVTSIYAAPRTCNSSHKHSAGLWMSAGFAGALGTTVTGAMLGSVIDWIVKNYNMVGLLWALSLFTLLKPLMRFIFRMLWKQGEICCSLGPDAGLMEMENLEIIDRQQRQRVTLQMEQRILSLEKGENKSGMEDRTAWVTDQKEREEIHKRRMKKEEAEMEQKTIYDFINTVMIKHVDFLAFSGVPMTVIAIVTSGFGLLGYGNHQSVLIVLLALVATMGYFLLQSSDFKFWMLIGCMGMFATFLIAMLTLHAGQEVVVAAMKMNTTGSKQSKEHLGHRVNYQSSLEAVNTAFFSAKLCQLGLGATVGGTLVRHSAGEGKVIAGAAFVAGGLLVGIEALAPVLGKGSRAGALLGVVGAAGVSVGATAAAAVRWSSWVGTLGTTIGLVVGALGMGKWHAVNIGLQLPVACVFAMIKAI